MTSLSATNLTDSDHKLRGKYYIKTVLLMFNNKKLRLGIILGRGKADNLYYDLIYSFLSSD